ncbi:HAAS signaling domain-containing protein [Cellulomonas fimi]|uniref:Uncharacterized protein n=1 Tax=Cellulomonas fimi TaxID=1708 RepID=A0A7Y0QGE9_CELFI|nr:hypothetical protein [Cellulomonas fimi]NMR20056.1 hypothetical protein [Cellulomonas fimi]
MTAMDTGVATDIAQYAEQVRAALADLGPDQVDDLTDGLEANLADALADAGRAPRGSLVDEFGSPDVYARELRAAAGLAPAAEQRDGVLRAALAAPWRAFREIDRAALARLRATRWFPGVEDLLVALRPAWWVLRGWTIAHLVLQVAAVEPYPAFWLPSTFAGWAVLVTAVVASAQWGRGRWRTGPRWHRLLRLVSAGSAVASVVLLLWVPSAQRNELASLRAAVDAPAVDGVVAGGERATNLFVYDADGEPVDGAQIVDQDGRPVTTEPYGGDLWRQQQYWPGGSDEPLFRTGAPGADGVLRWNVYPLRSAPEGAFDLDRYWETNGLRLRDDADGLLVEPDWPFTTRPPVAVPGASAAAEGATDDTGSAPTTDGTAETNGGPTDPAAGVAPSTPEPVAPSAAG